MARFGDRFDAQGVTAGSPQAARCIGYLTKYLTKQVGDCYQAATGAQHDHAARLAEALRFQPCSAPVRQLAALRHPAQERPARPGPGRCKGKAHDADHLGYAGRRVLVSRKWSGKTLADHRADRKDWLLRALGISATDPARYAWEPVAPTRARPTWTTPGGCSTSSPTGSDGRTALAEAPRRQQDAIQTVILPATGEAA